MTYGTFFQSRSRPADQCSTRAVNRALEFCTSGTATCRGLWNIHATSVSIRTSSATTATTGRNPGTEDTFHGQVSTQRGHGTAATRKQAKDVFGQSSSTRDHGLSGSGRAAWLNGNRQREQCNWNTVLIACCGRNCRKPINCWYRKNLDCLNAQ